MSDQIFDLDALMRPMTEEEIAAVYPSKDRKAPNFQVYQLKINSTEIGSRIHIDVPQVDEPEEAARMLRYNLNEAAKTRTVWKDAELTEDEARQYEANKKIDRFDREDGTHVTRMKGGHWMTEVPEPVVIRWKVDTKEVERTATEDGKEVKKTVKVPTRMWIVVVATTAIRKRAPRSATEETPASDASQTQDAPPAETPTENGRVLEGAAA